MAIAHGTYARIRPLSYQGAFPPDQPGDISGKANLEVQMLLALAVILLIIAVVGGIVVHPLLFVIAVLALLAFFGGRRRVA